MRGFTLVEMLITLIVVGIISMVSVMLFSFITREGTATQASLIRKPAFLSEALELKKILSSFINEFDTVNVSPPYLITGRILYPDSPFVELPATVTFLKDERKLVFEKETPVGVRRFEFEMKNIDKLEFDPSRYGNGVSIHLISGGYDLEFFVGGEG